MSGYAPGRRTYDNRIEVIVVCLNYSDFLAETLPFNLPHVDRLVVVTSHSDDKTRAVCQKWSVECVVTDAFHEKGEDFNKGAAINIGIQSLRQQGWILHLDADVVLPLQFRNMLDKSALQRDTIYGAERANVPNYRRWQHLKSNYHICPQFSYRYMVATDPDLPIGANLVHKQYGYCPIGYFQLWHSAYMHQHDLRYPDTEGSAENMDVQWSLRWPRRNRLLLPTVRVYHLESEQVGMGANWNGRRTKPFEP
jgi:glycosyltransferase involved in cell wall biosynthesis